jgi:hypothetical protein
MAQTAGKDGSDQILPHCSMRRRYDGTLLVAMLVAVWIGQSVSKASAQCSTPGVLQNQLSFRRTPSADHQAILVQSAVAVPIWKTITVGTFKNSFALLNALDAAGCVIGRSAEEILARPAFSVSATKTNVDLIVVSAAELGFHTDTVSLAEIYTRAQQLGFGLAAAEVAPQLRLQYLDQPLGEFLIGMEPIKTWAGDPVILTVANGGAGLVLIGQDGSADAEIHLATRFLFVHSKKVELAKTVQGSK